MKSQKGIENFKSIIDQRVSIPDAEWQYAVEYLSERTFDPRDYLVRAGDVVENFYFINTGLVRFFYCTEDGKEFNKHFAMENGFAGSFHSFTRHEPCSFFIQALERTETVVLPNNILNQLYDRHACWERLGRKIAEHLVLIKEAREKELLLDSLEIRYKRFLKEFPGLVDRIPQYHIASYLGVTDVALSRIRKKIK
ncbi:MAG TPA: Crp/Fnr family transcriptional regulator [Anaerolineales bacterium]|nr:Crp/Fnr family transcriptional regulator [Anaerolineales bacterium]